MSLSPQRDPVTTLPNKKGDCGASRAHGSVRLPVIESSHNPRGVIRPSKNSKRRAIVLALVHVIIIAHIIHWIYAGSTISPIEPSEAMEFSKQGIINAGLIFFAIALLSTLILGRWFCGWGCHVVALQDGCGWFMKKCGIRPKQFRSRTLIYVPLLLGLYMFIWPAFYRLAIAPWLAEETRERLIPWGVEMHLTTTDFWGTFPGWAVAIPFLAICGFAAVYFLGQKGFCTYGCPYGGFFAPLDEFAPARIRVTDACEQCGHCTAVCTSNVRVHEEVHEYGMVVDPGCMKCLDCVSVCPNDALYFGFGKPAVSKGPAKHQEPKRIYDMTLGQDIAVAVLFAVIFFAFRGDYARFPLLMAAGVAGVMTFIIWKAWRTLREPNAAMYRYQLKSKGAIKPAGVVLVMLAAILVGLVVQSGAVNGMTLLAGHHDDRVLVDRHTVYWDPIYQADDETRFHAQRALDWYTRSAAASLNGFGLGANWRSGIDVRRAWLHSVLGQMQEAELRLRGVLKREGDSPSEAIVAGMGFVLGAQEGKRDETLAWYHEALVERTYNGEPAQPIMIDEFIMWADNNDLLTAAAPIIEARVEKYPRDTYAMRWLGLLRLELGRISEGIATLERVLEIDPEDDRARAVLDQVRGMP